MHHNCTLLAGKVGVIPGVVLEELSIITQRYTEDPLLQTWDDPAQNLFLCRLYCIMYLNLYDTGWSLVVI